LDRFSFFFAFYGLILGLAVTELLSGLAGYARERRIQGLERQTALLALAVFLFVCATWIDAWDTLQGISLNFEGLAAPILTATFYYLAACMVFPRNPSEYDRLEDYFSSRKSFVASMLLAAEIAVSITFLPAYGQTLEQRPAVFWLWQVPYKIVIIGSFAALIFLRDRRAILAALWMLIALATIPYWSNGGIQHWIDARFDEPQFQAPLHPRH
jgi:hypothetical protein